MSTTNLEVFNQALAMIGHDRSITMLGGTTTEEARCNTFIAPARRTVLAFYPWEWLATDADVSPDVTSPVQDGPLYVFTKPTGCLRIMDVTDADGMPVVYDVVGTKIKSDCAAITVRYIADDADPDNWPPLILDAVVCELAARVCVPFTGNFERARELRKQAGLYMAQAASEYGPDSQQAEPANQQPGQQGG